MNSRAAPIVRFAPSPTGRIHIGNARTALINYFHAKKQGGEFVLRFDDTDVARSTREFADGIAEDLAWLGIIPDRTARQSERFSLYDAAADKLRAAGKLYACYETEEELTYRRNRQRAQHKPPVYDRAALKLTDADRAALEAQGRKPHWRFLLDPRQVTWHDGVRGDTTIDCASLSDPVLVRGDGTYLYTLPSVVDDIDMRVTDVIRGEDHVTNTAVQIQIFETLVGNAPRFAHHNLLTKPDGKGLSKRDGDLALAMLRDAGMEPTAVAAVAVLTGTSHAVEPVATLADLMGKFELSSVSHSSAKFDPAEIAALNARTLHLMPFDAVAARLAALGVGGGAALWDAVRGNLSLFKDVVIWWGVIASDETYASEDRELLQAAIAALPPEPWGDTTWSGWTKAVGAAAGKKGRALFHPLRLALTGREQGPELKLLLPLIGRKRALARLEAAAS